MKQISLLLLLVINSYGQSHSKIVDTIVTKSLFTKTIELQNKNFETKLFDLANEIDSKEIGLKREIATLGSSLKSSRLVLDDLNNKIKELNSSLESNNVSLDSIKNQSLNNDKNITSLGLALSQKQQYGLIILGFSLALLLLVYIVLNKKRTDDTKKLAAKQKEIFEKQIQDSQHIADWLSNESKDMHQAPKGEVDHSFAKRVADEIVRFTTNLSRMDESIKGFKQLSASVRKLEQSLNANHYELEDLLNKPFDIGMNLQANFVSDENLKEGESIITRIIKPQINYKGKLIQAAQVEVSQGE